MTEQDVSKAEVSSEKAYASAAESMVERRSTVGDDVPAKSKRARKAAAIAAAPALVAPASTAASADPVVGKAARRAPSPKLAIAKAKPVTAKPIAAKALAAKPVAAKPPPVKPVAVKAAPKPPAPVAAVKRAAAVAAESLSASTATIAKAASKTAESLGQPTIPLLPSITIKDTIMDMTSNYSAGLSDAVNDAQGKAKEALEKSSAFLGEVNDFTRANVEACVESSKILAAGLQDLGSTLVADGRSVFETMTADLKELAAAKSPAEFIKLQSELVRKSMDSAVATGSKNSEAVMKLASDALAPISGRVSVAVEKARVIS